MLEILMVYNRLLYTIRIFVIMIEILMVYNRLLYAIRVFVVIL